MWNISNWDEETERRVDRGVALFMKGYNCAQSVVMTFSDLYGLSPALMSRISASFGGGTGRMRLTCGTATGMFLLAGLEVADALDAPHDLFPEEFTPYPDIMVKKMDYEVVQKLAGEFQEANGSLSCKELLSISGCKAALNGLATPDDRNAAYYRKRPCARMVASAIRIYMGYLRGKYAPVGQTSSRLKAAEQE